MNDNTFSRRLEITKLLLAGRTLSVSEMCNRFSVGRKAIERDFDIIGYSYPVVSKKGRGGGYRLQYRVNPFQNALNQDQLCALKEVLKLGLDDDVKENLASIIREFGPYIETVE